MSDAQRKPETPNASNISLFLKDESLAGFVSRNATLDRAQFLSKHQYPVLLTSMPMDAEITVESILIPLKKKPKKPRSAPLDKTISSKFSALQKEVRAKTSSFYVGRAPECDITFAPKSLSRRHAVLAPGDGGVWTVTDLGSSNGTLVAGRRLEPQQAAPIPHSPISLDFGPDVQVHFLLPDDLYNYVCRFTDDSASTPHVSFPIKSSSSERLTTLTPRPDEDANREAGMTRIAADPGETQEEIPLFNPAASSGHTREKTPTGAIPTNIDRNIEKKLLKTVQTLAALDALILNVTARLTTDARLMSIYSSEQSGRVVDAAEYLVRMGPFLKQVFVTLSVGSGQPIEVYTKGP